LGVFLWQKKITYFQVGNILVVLDPIEIQSRLEGNNVIVEVTRSVQMSVTPGTTSTRQGAGAADPSNDDEDVVK